MLGETIAIGLVGAVVGPPRLLATALLPILQARLGTSSLDRRPVLRSIYGMIQRGSLLYDDKQQTWKLSDKGIRQVRSYMIDNLTLATPPLIWDKQWRIVSFDVPEQSRGLRDVFRRKLQELGFTYLQKSIWVYPFPCEKEIRELSHRLGLEEDVVVAVAHSLSPSERLLRKYSLSIV